MNLKLFLAFVLSVMIFNGCTSAKAIVSMQKSTDHFESLTGNPSVKYEHGAQHNALRVAQYLQEAIQTVETRQYTIFPNDVIIYVPNSIESFSTYTVSDIPRATVIGGKLFLSPRLFEQNDGRVKGILEHELSHLLITQKLGRWNAQLNLPHWFTEGLAVYVSDGAGAEKVSKEEAIQSILAGKEIIPDNTGSILFRKTANYFNLKTEMFYRQSSMFVEWLHNQDPAEFKHFLYFIYQGEAVAEAMYNSYGFSVAEGWSRFSNDILHT